MSKLNDNTRNELSSIRKAMSAALHRKDHAEYHRLGAVHRTVLRRAQQDTPCAGVDVSKVR